MQKFEREQIRELTADDLRDIVGFEIEKGQNPCLDRLFFVETRATKKVPRKIFPVYPAEVVGGKDGDMLVVYVVQFMAGQYGTACTTIPVGDIGVKCRFWTLPPVDAVMDAMPLKDAAEVQ